MIEGQSQWENEDFDYPVYDIKLYLMVRSQSLSLGNVKYLFIIFALRFILTRSGSISQGPDYGSNKTVQSFNEDYDY